VISWGVTLCFVASSRKSLRRAAGDDGCGGRRDSRRCAETERAVASRTDRLVIPVDAVRNGLNSDPEWAIASRFWNARIRFYADSDQLFMRIENGRVVDFRVGSDGFQASTIHVGGPLRTWREMLKPIPPPLFQDFFPASIHHGISLGGDLVSLYAYYSALSRILVVMRREVNKVQS
jgi:hypothetical protein